MSLIRIFVGTDRSQQLAVEVLKYSVNHYTQSAVEIQSMVDLKIPQPKDIRQSQRTGFSFSRWAIPELCKFQGKGLYLDADMMVFADIQELGDTPFDGSIAILTQDTSKGEYRYGPINTTLNESSVSIFNCDKSRFTLDEVVEGLDGKYPYENLMRELCIFKEAELSRVIPRCWNSLDYWDSTSKLVHFTNTTTQPWVSLENKYGHIWTEMLKRMLTEKYISEAEIQNEIELGYVRPSLMKELTEKICDDPSSNYAQQLVSIDKKARFIKHKSVAQWNKRRNKSIRKYNLAQAKQVGMLSFIKELAKCGEAELRELKSRFKFILSGG